MPPQTNTQVYNEISPWPPLPMQASSECRDSSDYSFHFQTFFAKVGVGGGKSKKVKVS